MLLCVVPNSYSEETYLFQPMSEKIFASDKPDGDGNVTSETKLLC